MTRIDYDERWAQGKILLWLNEVIRQGKFPFEAAEQEVKIKTPQGHRRYPDIVIWYKKPDRIACIIELKQPMIDVYNEDLVHAALEKATWAGIPFFATWNLNKFVLWETFRPGTSLLDRRLHHWDILDIKRVPDLEKYEKTVKEFIFNFLSALAKYYEEKVTRVKEFIVPKIYEIQVIPKLYPDEILVYRLKTAVDSLYIPISEYILKNKEENPEFFSKVAEWFVKQGWIFSNSEEDYDRLARQAVYLLINKLLFYNVLRSRFKLGPIDVGSVKTGKELNEKLQDHFNTGVRLGYGIIFAADFLETIPIPNEAVNELKKLIEELNKYDFSKIGYDVIGKVFEKLIPRTERHKLGQYFTRTDVVDLILGFTIKHPDAKVLDPSCGSGTFLVRAYQRKRYLARKLYENSKYPKPDKPHEELIRELWGIDIAKFPAHLAEINLIVRNLKALENKPVIACRDFFEIEPERKTPLYELAYKVPELTREQIEVAFPKDFDAVVTNPPYTRQEEMEDMLMGGYKNRLRQLVKRIHGTDVGKRSSIYVYFFFHGGAFIKEGGRVGLITSNSWLDVDYGKYLQEYFLKNFKIIAIIESKVERWFEDADIITAITILERCSNNKERDENLVKFVQLKVPLRELIPEPNVEDEEERERLRWGAIDKLVKLIEETNEYYEDDKIRIFPKKQAELWDEGYDDEKGKYVGSKWGKYLRAPKIFFKILKKGQERGLFIPLKKIAIVRRGFTTGANEFFYLTKGKIRELGIEREFWIHPLTKEQYNVLSMYPHILKQLLNEAFIDHNGKYFVSSQYATKYKLEDVLIDGKVIWIPNYVIKSPRELKKYIAEPTGLDMVVLLIHKDKSSLTGTNVLKYILEGEDKEYHRRPTCRSRRRWYELQEISGDILCMMTINDRYTFWYNPARLFIDARLYGIDIVVEDIDKEVLAAILNSTITALFVELWGRVNLGQGALDVKVYEYSSLPVIDPRLIDNNLKTKIKDLFRKLIQISADSVVREMNENRIRRELDRLILCDILGLSPEDFSSLYNALADLITSRIKRAESARREKKKTEINLTGVAESILKHLNLHIGKFPNEYLSNYSGPWITELILPKGNNVVLGTDLGGFYVKIDEKEVYRSWKSHIAKYIYYALLCGNNIVKIPKDENIVKKAVEIFEEDLKKLKEEVSTLLKLTVPDAKIRDKVENIIWKRLLRGHRG
ncbi:MAG: N-6 DNA methylase [Desulfurococcales archaeon]|nr:N-6 DNA methylase [Desulfurococcales archaeon]